MNGDWVRYTIANLTGEEDVWPDKTPPLWHSWKRKQIDEFTNDGPIFTTGDGYYYLNSVYPDAPRTPEAIR